MLGIVQDITDQMRTKELLREQAEALQIINDFGRVLSAELDLKKLVQALTDAATSLVGAQFGAFFYNVLDAGGGSYMLYALSGVDRRHFERLPMPRATALFGPTFRGEGIIRLADVTQDPRYGQNESASRDAARPPARAELSRDSRGRAGREKCSAACSSATPSPACSPKATSASLPDSRRRPRSPSTTRGCSTRCRKRARRPRSRTG